MVYFFLAGVIVDMENAKFWPILTNFGYYVRNLRTFCVLFTGLNNVAKLTNMRNVHIEPFLTLLTLFFVFVLHMYTFFCKCFQGNSRFLNIFNCQVIYFAL